MYILAILNFAYGFIPRSIVSSKRMLHAANSAALRMTASQVVTIQPTAEEWLEIAEPGVKKATLAMFRGKQSPYTV